MRFTNCNTVIIFRTENFLALKEIYLVWVFINTGLLKLSKRSVIGSAYFISLLHCFCKNSPLISLHYVMHMKITTRQFSISYNWSVKFTDLMLSLLFFRWMFCYINYYTETSLILLAFFISNCVRIVWYSFLRKMPDNLTLLWRRSLSYRNQFIDLHRKSMDRFLYDRELPHERVNSVFLNVNLFF